uniref:ARF7 effector protein C-terminal domain-containing protein n=1 Tax=Periophthalmus magnuspinnatus TaxID=409849 RepID=A0A3B4BCK3_9GOBI
SFKLFCKNTTVAHPPNRERHQYTTRSSLAKNKTKKEVEVFFPATRGRPRINRGPVPQSLNAKSKVYDANGRLLSNGKDLCDCLDVDCMGCFFPCPDCGSRKCGVECRCDRKWLYEQVEVEGGQIIRNKYAL